MNSLHLVFNAAGLDSCLKLRNQQDEIVLLGDAVFHDEEAQFKAIAEDCVLRGVSHTNTIGMDDLVELTTAHSPIVSWST